MEKDSLHGIYIPCPYTDCKKIAIADGFLDGGDSIFRIKCGHCGRPIVVTIKTKTDIILSKFVNTVLIIFIVFEIFSTVALARKINCSLFETQKEAQSFYNTNPILLHFLDRDKDGKVCEHLKG